MKLYYKLICILLTGICAGCEKNDSDTDYGITSIYMPQALVANLTYAVPAGLDSATRNYRIDVQNDKVNIILGVTRSGEQPANGYTVNIVANTDTINQLLAKKVLDPATTMLLPSIYTLPQNISVAPGKNAGTFYLSVNRTQLKTYAGKKLALVVALANPTMYTLNNAISKVMVIIDVNALKL